jgi:hypothetical protein
MAPPLEWPAAGAKRAAVRAFSPFALATLVVPPAAAGHPPAPRPPSSIEPKIAKQVVIVSHLHRRVRACTSIPSKNATSCAPQLGDAEATTRVFLVPVATPSGAPSRHRRIVVAFSDMSGVQKQTVELPVGEWTVEWPGCREVGRLVISAARGVVPRIALRTTTGSCELSSAGCRLLAGTTEQRLTVEE